MRGVLVDTCIWSLVLRSKTAKEKTIADTLSRLIDENRAKMIGSIRQEVLSGYSKKESYERLRSKLLHFPNEKIADADYEAAAEYSNLCRVKGVQGSAIDFFICAVAIRLKMKIYTTDKDFLSYAKHIPISIFDEG